MLSAADVISQLATLPPAEVVKVRNWLIEQDGEPPALLTAIDEGLESLAKNGARAITEEELASKVRRWAGVSK